MMREKDEETNVPGFIIIGAQKAGTTYLFNLLSNHPNLHPAAEKEIRFFSQNVAFERGGEWYKGFFPASESLRPGDLAFEASPDYLYSPEAAARIAGLYPTVKLIVTLRNPTERAYSAWNMYRLAHDRPVLPLFPASRFDQRVRDRLHELLHGNSFPSFEESIRKDLTRKCEDILETDFVEVGFYDEQIARYLEHFDREQILVVTREAMRLDPISVASRITDFLGVPPFNWVGEAVESSNVADYRSPMSVEVEAILNEVYRSHNAKLARLIGFDPGWPS